MAAYVVDGALLGGACIHCLILAKVLFDRPPLEGGGARRAISASEEEARGVIAPRRGNLACRCPDHTRQAAARGRRGTAGEPPQGGVHVAPDKELTHLICVNTPIAPWHQQNG